MKNLKNSLVASVIMIMTFSLFSCKENWEPFNWAVDNKSPETIAVSGVDNCGCTGQITIVSDENEGDVVLLCENYSQLYLEPAAKPEKPLDGVFDNGEALVKVDGNKINIHFYPIADINEEHSMIILQVKTREDKHPIVYLMLLRAQDINNPFPDAF